MTEKVPSFTLYISGGEELELTPDNAVLYTFLGRTVIGNLEIENSSVNHVFVTTGSNEQGQTTGSYFFREVDGAYDSVSQHMTEHRYPMVLNQRVIPEYDLRAWLEKVDRDTAQFASQIPDEL